MKKDTLDRYGLEVGDCVTRMKVGAHGDNFKCHEFSFGRIRAFQLENKKSRPEAADKFGVDEWVEVVVLPFDDKMAPKKEQPWIQWGPEECIKISKFQYILRAISWPVIKRIFNKPLNGRNMDRVK